MSLIFNKNSSDRPWKAEFEEIAKLFAMSKVRSFADIAPNIGFLEFDFYALYRSLTLHAMAENFGIVKIALRPEVSQDPDEADGNPVHLLRHTHGKRGTVGGQDRAESTVGACLMRKYAYRKVLSWGTMPLFSRI